MDRDRVEALVAYSQAASTIGFTSVLLMATTETQGWLQEGRPTGKLRDDVLEAIDAWSAAFELLGGRTTPAPSADALERLAALRALLVAWRPNDAISAELAVAAGNAAGALNVFARGQSFGESAAPQPETFDDRGLPLPRTSLDTSYAAAARTLVVRVGAPRIEGRWPRDTLWVREVAEPRYRQVTMPDARLALRSVVITAGALFAFVKLDRVEPDERGANDGGIYRVSLPDGALEQAVAPGPRERGWVSDLLGVSADGATLHVVAAGLHAETQEVSPGHSRTVVGYSLASLDIATGELTEIAPLPGMFA